MPSGDFDQSTKIGLIFVVVAACLSTFAVSCLLLYIGTSVIYNPEVTRGWKSTHVHYYFMNLLACEVVQGIGGIMTVKWTIDMGVTEGTYCTAQGIFQQMGDVGVALCSLAIAVYTFCVLAVRWHPPFISTIVVIVLIWIFLALITGVASAKHGAQGYYGDTKYWCWITDHFEDERIALEYFWMWLAAMGNIVIYVLLAFLVKGFLSFSGCSVRFHKPITPVESDPLSIENTNRSRTTAIAVQMLFYPAVYTITVFPMTVTRWMSFSGASVPFAATAFASVTFWSSGLFNVILFAITRPRLLPSRSKISSSPSDHIGMSLKSPVTPDSTQRTDDRFSDIEASERTSHFSPLASPDKRTDRNLPSPDSPPPRDSDGSMAFVPPNLRIDETQ